MLVLLTLLFLDVSGTLQKPLHVLAHIQFIPALLAGNLIIVALLVLLTLYFGRVYCSVICPLGLMQDVLGRLGKKKRSTATRIRLPRRCCAGRYSPCSRSR